MPKCNNGTFAGRNANRNLNDSEGGDLKPVLTKRVPYPGHSGDPVLIADGVGPDMGQMFNTMVRQSEGEGVDLSTGDPK